MQGWLAGLWLSLNTANKCHSFKPAGPGAPPSFPSSDGFYPLFLHLLGEERPYATNTNGHFRVERQVRVKPEAAEATRADQGALLAMGGVGCLGPSQIPGDRK